MTIYFVTCRALDYFSLALSIRFNIFVKVAMRQFLCRYDYVTEWSDGTEKKTRMQVHAGHSSMPCQ